MKRNKIAKVIFLLGFLIFIYPHMAQYINKFNATKLVNDYNGMIAGMSEEERRRILEELRAYGNSDETIDLGFDSDFFATISIPELNLDLPIYLGASDENLRRGIAYIEGTSLPMGGHNTHSVLAGHSGYANHEWFSNIDNLDYGDLFYINNIEGMLTYKVIRKQVIEPYDTSQLQIVENKDLVTLLTCVSPGLPNNKRLIVTGERVNE